ncbi:MAG: ABC transporter substrate-binding protein [Candidatus Tectomicrobia bacterium]|nr:ABC transporter substrate-binding protein [Candidatus Tectomicrobia bacterium]
MRRFRRSIVAGFMVLGFLLGGAGLKTAAGEATKFVADWVIGAKHAPFLLARDKGFYKKAGLDVAIERGYGSGAAGQLLATGKADFSFVDLGSMVILRTKGAKLKQVAAIHAIFPIGYVGLRSKGIREPKDMAGKTFGGSPVASSSYLLPTYLKNVGVDPGSVKLLHMKITSIVPSFLAGTIDLMGVYTINSVPIIRYNLRQKGIDPDKELSLFLGVDIGIDAYSNGLTVRDDTIRDKPELVRRWVRATMDAFRSSVQNPKESLDNFMAKHPEINKVIAADEFDAMIRSLLSPEARQTALGWTVERKVGITQEIMFESGQAQGGKLPLKDLYTNEFLEKRPMAEAEIPPNYRRLGLK